MNDLIGVDAWTGRGQRDQDSQDFKVDFDMGSAGTIVESGPQLTSGLPRGIRLSVG